jgi:hypothetical protein
LSVAPDGKTASTVEAIVLALRVNKSPTDACSNADMSSCCSSQTLAAADAASDDFLLRLRLGGMVSTKGVRDYLGTDSEVIKE